MKNEKILALTRMATILITFLNSVLAHYGKPLIKTDDQYIYQTISDAILLFNIGWVYWKNNNLTGNAIEAQKVKKKLDEGEVIFIGEPEVKEKSEVLVDNVEAEKHKPRLEGE